MTVEDVAKERASSYISSGHGGNHFFLARSTQPNCVLQILMFLWNLSFPFSIITRFQTKVYRNLLLQHLLNAAKACIPTCWGIVVLPSIHLWVMLRRLKGKSA